MGFWDDHAKAEAAHAEAEAAKAPPPRLYSQNAPAECLRCGHEGADVMFGLCAPCDAFGTSLKPGETT